MRLRRRVERILKTKLRRFVGGRPAGRRRAERPDVQREEGRTGTQRPCTTPRDPREAESLAILGLSASATPDDIRTAYRRLCRRYHPDRFAGNAEKVRLANALVTELNAAYAFLRRRR